MKFSISHHNEADFKPDGLRAFFKYRDPGIRHNELGHGDDLELFVLVAPADFKPVDDCLVAPIGD